jgi:hypothetical protein
MKFYAPSREGLRLVVTPIEPALHRKLKIFAAGADYTLEQTCRLAFEKFLAEPSPASPRLA